MYVVVCTKGYNQIFYGPFKTNRAAVDFLNSEASPKLPLGVTFKVVTLEEPFHLQSRKAFTPIGWDLGS